MDSGSWDSVVFYVDFGLVEDGHYCVLYFVACESFVSPLEEGFVDDWEEYLGSGAAEWSQSGAEASCEDDCFQGVHRLVL